MPQLDVSTFLPQLFWLILSFGGLYYYLSKFCLPNLRQILHSREHAIDKILAEAEKNKEEASKIKNEYEVILMEAIKIKDSMLNEATKEINKIIDHKIAEHELELKIIENSALEKISKFQKNSSEDIKKIATEITGEILEQLLSDKLDKKLITQAIEKQINGEGGV